MLSLIRYSVHALAAYYVLAASDLVPWVTPNPLPLSDSQHKTFITVLKWVLGLGLVREVNAKLNRLALNNWRFTNDKRAWKWTEEVAVVTGGSNGIGAAVVRELVSHGIKVAVLDIEPLSKDFQDDERKRIQYYPCDITSREAVYNAAEAIRSDLGPPSILINNAGIGNANTILQVTPQRLRKIFDLNIISHWNTVQEFLPDMVEKKKGHIMSVASMASFVGLAGMVDYSCVKVGLVAFHEGLTQELKHRYNCPQIKTSIIHPNWTRTRINAPVHEKLTKRLSKLMEPSDVAKAMVQQIINVRSGQLILGAPELARSVRAFPIWLQELIRDKEAGMVTMNATSDVAERVVEEA